MTNPSYYLILFLDKTYQVFFRLQDLSDFQAGAQQFRAPATATLDDLLRFTQAGFQSTDKFEQIG